MLDIRRIKEDPNAVKAALRAKEVDCDAVIDRILELDETRRALIASTETRKARQNKVSKEIPALKKAGQDVSAVFAEMAELKAGIAEDATKLDASGEALRFSVSDNPTFKNTTYGVLAVEKTSEMPNEFQLYAYETEEDYQAAFANTDPMELNLMEFRGSFSLTYGSDGTTIVGAKATAVEGGDSINISDCLDVDNGTYWLINCFYRSNISSAT